MQVFLHFSYFFIVLNFFLGKLYLLNIFKFLSFPHFIIPFVHLLLQYKQYISKISNSLKWALCKYIYFVNECSGNYKTHDLDILGFGNGHRKYVLGFQNF